MTRTSLLILAMINVPMYIGMSKVFFKSKGEFRSGLVSIYKNRNNFFLGWDGLADSWGEMKTFLFLLLCACIYFCEYYFLMQ